MTEVSGDDLREKAKTVSQGIMRLVWLHKYHKEGSSVEIALREFDCGVYLNGAGKFAVRLDDGTEYYLNRPCSYMIRDLFEAKAIFLKGNCDSTVRRKANAFDKFEPFFNNMIELLERF